MKRIFFIDFDGTITQVDTCDAMAARYCRPGYLEINRRWADGEIGTVECARQLLRLMEVSKEELIEFLISIPIDPWFKDFVKLADRCGDEIYIVSDGFDLNITTILAYHGIPPLKYFANQLLSGPDGFDIAAPHSDPDCTRCGTCKTSLIRQLKTPESLTVYIGDGISDFCPAAQADVVFAKNKLAGYCQANGINALPFRDFSDIIRWMTVVTGS